jgi:L-malate glycosyltransferase
MNRKAKVLLIGSSSPHVANHLSRIEGDDFIIEVISDNNKFLRKNQTFHKVDFALKIIVNWFKSPKKIRQIITTFNPDVIHVHQANSIGFFTVLANRKTKKPIVLTAWGSDVLINPKQSVLLKIMVKYILRNVDTITSDSEYMAEVIRDLHSKEGQEIVICNFGVQEFDIPIEKKKIIYSNRTHNPLYRIEEVLNAFARFKKSESKDEWIIKIAGRGSETESLKQLVQELNIQKSVEFVGFVDAQTNASLYAESTYFISIPNSDATAMSLLEAMYFKCVPILSNLPANREWIKSGVNGLIVADLKSNFIKQAICFDTCKMGLLNREIVLKKGTVAISQENFRNVLLKLINH